MTSAGERGGKSPPGGRSLRILLAEDNELSTMLVSRYITRLGHVLTEASDGGAARNLLAGQVFDVVLMDLQMPVMNGMEVTRRLRAGELGEANRAVPVIALTAHALDEYRTQCRKAGMTGFLTKPVELDDLAAAINAVMGPGEADLFRSSGVAAPPPAELDGEEARRRLGVDQGVFATIVAAAMAEIQEMILGCGRAIKQGDAETVQSLAHTMKSTAASMGAGRCSALAKELQDAARDKDMGRARSLLAEMERSFVRVRALLGAHGPGAGA